MSDSESEIRTPEEQFVYDLQGVYDMEQKLVDTLEEMSEAVTDDDLRAGFAIHRTETETQVRRVEEAFDALGREPTRRDCPIVDGLVEDKKRYDARVADDGLRNVRYLTAATKTEQIEITAYEGLLATAEMAGLGDDVTAPLEANLAQEEKTLRKLQGLSSESNLEALWNRLTDS